MVDTKKFEVAYEKAKNLYAIGEYKEALNPSLESVDLALDILAIALRKRMWIARQVGYKDPKVRNEAYEIAMICAKQLLEISKNVEERNSAIKILILLPGMDTEGLCKMGLKELDEAHFIYQKRDNMKAEFMNSLGIEVGKTNFIKAFHIFNEAFKIVEERTTVAGHLMQNTATLFLRRKNETVHKGKKMSYSYDAIKYLGKALENYPEDQKGHREAVEKKIANTETEIKNNFQ